MMKIKYSLVSLLISNKKKDILGLNIYIYIYRVNLIYIACILMEKW